MPRQTEYNLLHYRKATGSLKYFHDKYNSKTQFAEHQKYVETFEEAMQYNEQIRPHVNKVVGFEAAKHHYRTLDRACVTSPAELKLARCSKPTGLCLLFVTDVAKPVCTATGQWCCHICKYIGSSLGVLLILTCGNGIGC